MQKRLQLNLFEDTKTSRDLVRKLPFRFGYTFLDDAGRQSDLMIEDWEIGALYWNVLKSCNGNEDEACQKVRNKYWTNFANQKDVYLFLGTTLRWHLSNAENPFVIVGVFYPDKQQPELF